LRPPPNVTNPAPLYPIALRLDGQRCLVVGAGSVAARKVASLLSCGAQVTVIAPKISPQIECLSARFVRRAYRPGDVGGYRLVIAATGVREVDRAVFRDAEDAGVLVNGVDDVEACRFFVPALLRRGPVTVAVSTAGTSPFLAAWLRDRIGEDVGSEIAGVAELLGEARRVLKEAGSSTEGADWISLLDEDLVSAVAAGREEEARRRLEEWLACELGRIRGKQRE
jgi:precorrin-2 dehydrogenase/sirohydrochlorin ferrochelatase